MLGRYEYPKREGSSNANGHRVCVHLVRHRSKGPMGWSFGLPDHGVFSVPEIEVSACSNLVKSV